MSAAALAPSAKHARASKGTKNQESPERMDRGLTETFIEQ
jgi:hypothetical protein